MYKLIPILREDRKKEIEEYKSRGYDFINPLPEYIYIRNITILYKTKRYVYQVRVDGNEVKFYLTYKEADVYIQSIYLTIEQLYQAFLKIDNKLGKDIINAILYNYIENDEVIDLVMLYNDNQFKINCINENKLDELENIRIPIPNTNIEVEGIEIIFLLFLIQEKSNYFFSISKHKKYHNGLIRLMIVLLNKSNDNEFLEKLGWVYTNDKFTLRINSKSTKKNKLRKNIKVNKDTKKRIRREDRKYYLTNKEFTDIMET